MTRATEDTPTLLVLTRGPGLEQRRKKLLPVRFAEAETRLHEQSLADVIACGRRAGCRVIVSCPDRLDLGTGVRYLDQRGRTFGERFADALERAQDEATGPLLVVGSDTPGLGHDHLQQALARLREEPGGVIVGPAVDGGFYLLASARPLHGVDWQRVSWCSPRTRQTLCSCLEEAGRPVRFLEPQADLDNPPDLERWLASAAGVWRLRLAEIRRVLTQRLRLPVPTRPPGVALRVPVEISDRAPPR